MRRNRRTNQEAFDAIRNRYVSVQRSKSSLDRQNMMKTIDFSVNDYSTQQAHHKTKSSFQGDLKNMASPKLF